MKAKPFSNPAFFVLALMIVASIGCKERVSGNLPYLEDSVRNHILPIRQAIEYTSNFRTVRDSVYSRLPGSRSQLDFGQAEAFNRHTLAVLLNQKDSSGQLAAGIRIYYGLDKGGQVRMVLVPYDSRGNDIINELIGNKAVLIPGISSAAAAPSDNGQTIENGQRCPVVCDQTSGLNGGN